MKITIMTRSIPSILFALVLMLSATMAAETIFVGSANRDGEAGVYVSEFEDGRLIDPRRILELEGRAEVELTSDKKRMYVSEGATERDADGSLIALRVLESGELKELNRVDSTVDHFCSLAISPGGRHVIGTSFARGVVSCFLLADGGEVGKQTHRLELPKFEKDNKAMARAHDVEFSPDGEFVFVADLFSDRVYVFKFDEKTGALEESGFATSDSFEGPRHLIFNEDGSVLYVLSQKGSSIVAFRHDGKGSLTEFQSISTLPPDYDGPQNHSAEILVHPSGKFLYASNRVHDSVVGFRIAENGSLTKIQSVSSGGGSPWSFIFDAAGEHLICSNMKSSNLVVFHIKPSSGELSRTDHEVSIPDPLSLGN